MTLIEEISDPLLHAFLLPCSSLRRFRRPPPLELGKAGGQRFSHLGHRPEDGLGQFRDGVKLANLVGDVAEHLGDGNRIEGGTIRGDAAQGQPPGVEGGLEPPEELSDVVVAGVVV